MGASVRSPRHIPARLFQAFDKTRRDGIGDRRDDDGNSPGCVDAGLRLRRGNALDQVHILPHKGLGDTVGRRQISLRNLDIDGHILSIDVPVVLERSRYLTFMEGSFFKASGASWLWLPATRQEISV
jgi:hypothetical protein